MRSFFRDSFGWFIYFSFEWAINFSVSLNGLWLFLNLQLDIDVIIMVILEIRFSSPGFAEVLFLLLLCLFLYYRRLSLCCGSAWVINLRSSQFFSELCLSLDMYVDFLISHIYADAFEYSRFFLKMSILVFDIWLPKDEKEKNEGVGKDTSPLNPLEIT